MTSANVIEISKNMFIFFDMFDILLIITLFLQASLVCLLILRLNINITHLPLFPFITDINGFFGIPPPLPNPFITHLRVLAINHVFWRLLFSVCFCFKVYFFGDRSHITSLQRCEGEGGLVNAYTWLWGRRGREVIGWHKQIKSQEKFYCLFYFVNCAVQ